MSLSDFYLWLEQQTARTDLVGEYARRATRTNTYPRLSSRLHVLLRHEHESRRRALKAAHKEWRKHRKQLEQAVSINSNLQAGGCA